MQKMIQLPDYVKDAYWCERCEKLFLVGDKRCKYCWRNGEWVSGECVAHDGSHAHVATLNEPDRQLKRAMLRAPSRNEVTLDGIIIPEGARRLQPSASVYDLHAGHVLLVLAEHPRCCPNDHTNAVDVVCTECADRFTTSNQCLRVLGTFNIFEPLPAQPLKENPK